VINVLVAIGFYKRLTMIMF